MLQKFLFAKIYVLKVMVILLLFFIIINIATIILAMLYCNGYVI